MTSRDEPRPAIADGAAPITVRDARPDERDAVAALTLRAYAELARVMTPTAWAGLEGAVHAGLASTEGAERIVAERDGVLLGSVLLFPPATDAYGGLARPGEVPELRLLAVAPEARGQGIGRLLVDECVRRARRTGATALGLHTSASMRAAIHLYERMGFVRAAEHDFQPPGGELVTAYRLELGGGR
ncbi:MAG TPA: GNAT family N-acetyltransferase [Gemmatimonadaceae bacterium]|nr:GNAT family N-acetyltransferase [Gemmatimonadaceae bacterium]